MRGSNSGLLGCLSDPSDGAISSDDGRTLWRRFAVCANGVSNMTTEETGETSVAIAAAAWLRLGTVMSEARELIEQFVELAPLAGTHELNALSIRAARWLRARDADRWEQQEAGAHPEETTP